LPDFPFVNGRPRGAPRGFGIAMSDISPPRRICGYLSKVGGYDAIADILSLLYRQKAISSPIFSGTSHETRQRASFNRIDPLRLNRKVVI
jgi:hypothetical protein